MMPPKLTALEKKLLDVVQKYTIQREPETWYVRLTHRLMELERKKGKLS
jgi:hypothetical protein